MDKSTPELTEHTCKSCGNTFTGLYCNICGEKVIEPKDRSFKTFIGNFLTAITLADNRFLKTLWLTIKNPGFLSKEYANGRRVNYIRPLQMFFVLNLVYFLFPVLQLFSSTLKTQMYYVYHSPLVRSMVIGRLTEENMSLAGFSVIYDGKTTVLAKLLIVVFVWLASLPLSVIFRKKNRYFTDHVALSVELACYNIFINAILLHLIFFVLSKIFKWSGTTLGDYLNDTTLTIIFISTNLYFIYRAAQTFYGQTGKRLIFKSALGVIGIILSLEVYKLLLFFITFYSIQYR